MATINVVTSDNPGLSRDVLDAVGRGDTTVNVKDFGAIGDGIADDTDAITNAFAVNGAIYLPEGRYKYTGPGLDHEMPTIVGDGRKHTYIDLGASSFLFVSSKMLLATYVADIQVNGGEGVFKHTRTDNNVTQQHIFERVQFLNYTKFGFSSDSMDMPYVQFRSCQFWSANATDSIGVAIGGNPAGVTITGCSFTVNRVHVKFRAAGSNAFVTGNTFEWLDNTTTGGPRVSLWFVPNPTAIGAGHGLEVTDNKFGNEHLEAGDFKILYADEGAGTINGEIMPDLVTASTGFVNGHRISNNLFSYNTDDDYSVIYSMTPEIRNIALTDCFISGGDVDYIVKFDMPNTTPKRFNSDNIFGPFTMDRPQAGVPVRLSNTVGLGQIVDPLGFLQEGGTVRPSGNGTAAAYVELNTAGLSSGGSGSSGNLTSGQTDAMGGTDAYLMEYAIANGFVFTNLAAMTPGVPVWVEFDLKAPASNAISQITAKVWDNVSNVHWERAIVIPDNSLGWVSYAFTFTPRTAGSTPRLNFVNDYTDELEDVYIGRVRVYHGHDRQIGGKRPAVSDVGELFDALGDLGVVVNNYNGAVGESSDLEGRVVALEARVDALESHTHDEDGSVQ